MIKELRNSSTYKVLHEDEMELLKLQMQAAGKEEGLKEGLEKGKVVERKEIAKAMLAKGYAVEEVVALTGLSMAVVGRMGK